MENEPEILSQSFKYDDRETGKSYNFIISQKQEEKEDQEQSTTIEITQDFINRILALSSVGSSHKEIAALLKIPLEAFNMLLKKHPSLKASIDQEKASTGLSIKRRMLSEIRDKKKAFNAPLAFQYLFQFLGHENPTHKKVKEIIEDNHEEINQLKPILRLQRIEELNKELDRSGVRQRASAILVNKEKIEKALSLDYEGNKKSESQ